MNKKDQKILSGFRDRMKAHVKPEVAARRWFDITNADGDVAEIRIYDEISWWGLTADDFATELDQITAPKILVMINSPGGEVFDGIAIYNALRAHPAEVTTRVDGIAASIASIIVQAGDKRVMLSASQMMIHDASGIVWGNAEDMREYAGILERQDDNFAGIYAARGTQDKAAYRALMDETTWFTDEEAVEAGLADEVIDPSNSDSATAKARLAKKTLNDEVAEAMDVISAVTESAERVVALRAEKGKELSQVNRDSLVELDALTERLRALLPDDTETDVSAAPPPEEVDDGAIAEAARVEYLKFVASSL